MAKASNEFDHDWLTVSEVLANEPLESGEGLKDWTFAEWTLRPGTLRYGHVTSRCTVQCTVERGNTQVPIVSEIEVGSGDNVVRKGKHVQTRGTRLDKSY